MTDKKIRASSVRSEIISWVSFLIIIIMLLAGIIINIVVRGWLEREIKSKGEAIAKNIAANSTEAMLTKDELLLGVYLDKIKGDKSILYGMILDGDGKSIAHTDITVPKGVFYDDLVSLRALHSDTHLIQTDKSEKYGRYIDISVPIMSGKIKIGIVRLGFSGSEIFKTIRAISIYIFMIAIIGISMGIFILNVVVTRITRPIKSLSKGAEIIGSGNLDFVIKSESGNEIGRLAESFNQMTSKLKIAQRDLIEKEKMKQELKIAREIQQSLLPEGSPMVAGFDIQSFYRSAKEIGGDYYDFLNMPGNRLGIVIADVSGKGVPGSLGMAVARSIFRTQVDLGGTAKEILIRTNELVYKEIKRGIFVSMFFTILDIDNKTLNCSSAGHNPPLIFHGGKVQWMNLEGLALGVDKGPIFKKTVKDVTLKMEPGDVLMHYTDGISEAKNMKDQEFTEERLLKYFESARGMTASEFNQELVKALEAFTQGAEQSDDITLVTVKAK